MRTSVKIQSIFIFVARRLPPKLAAVLSSNTSASVQRFFAKNAPIAVRPEPKIIPSTHDYPNMYY